MTSWALPAPGGSARPVSLRPYSVDDSSDVGWVVLGDPCVPHVMWSEQTISPSECVSFLEHVTIQIASTALRPDEDLDPCGLSQSGLRPNSIIEWCRSLPFGSARSFRANTLSAAPPRLPA